MSNYKENLIGSLKDTIFDLYAGEMVSYEITQSGLYCYFDVAMPFNPEKMKAIDSQLRQEEIPREYELSGFSGVYLDGDASKKMLQRIYVTAFDEVAELQEYKAKLASAAEHDHKKLGGQLGLFSTSDLVGQGLVLWHPKGATIQFLLEQFSQSAHMLNGYQWVYTPHIGRSQLWKTSGHLDNFKDSMYNPIDIDGDEYYSKPMNCPFHFII